MTVTAHVALYPIKVAHPQEVVRLALEATRTTGATLDEGAISSTLHGTAEQIFAALSAAFQAAATFDDAVLVVTVARRPAQMPLPPER